MRLHMKLTKENLIDIILIILCACALAGVILFYSLSNHYDSYLVGSGRRVQLTFLPTSFITPYFVVLSSMLLSILLSYLLYKDKFKRCLTGTMMMFVFALVIFWIAYLYPGIISITGYHEGYYMRVIGETIMAVFLTIPVGFIGTAIGSYIADKTEETEGASIG